MMQQMFAMLIAVFLIGSLATDLWWHDYPHANNLLLWAIFMMVCLLVDRDD